MKKLKLILSILLCSVAMVLMSQVPKIQMSDYESPNGRKKRSAVTYSVFFGNDESEFYVVEQGPNEYDIAIMDAESMTKKSSFLMEEIEVDNRKPRWVKFMFHDGKITLIYAVFNKRTDRFTVYGKITDQSGEVEMEDMKLMDIKAAKRKQVGSISASLSEDDSKILIFREPPGKRFEKEKMEIALFDRDLNELFSRQLTFPYKYKTIVVEDIDVSNEGKVIIVTQYTKEQRRGSRKRGPANEMVNKIFTIDEENDELKEIEIEQKGYAFSSLEGYILNEQNKMMFTGFFREARTVRRRRDANLGANGIYYITIDLATDEIDQRNYDKLDKADLEKIFAAVTTTKRAKKSANKGLGLRSYVIRNVLYDTIGGIIITLEKTYVVENCHTDSRGNRTCTYTYYDMELVEFILNNEGEIVRTQVIPKKQISSTSFYHGIITLEQDGKVVYVYNDTEKNLNPKKVKSRGNPGFQYAYSSNARIFGNNKKRLVAVNVEEDGSLNKEALTPSHKENITLYPRLKYAHIENGVVVAWCVDARKRKITLIKLYME